MVIEAAVETADEARFALAQGATRLEVCDFSVEGGRTPLLIRVREIRNTIPAPIHVMIRPRGGDFVYAEPEIRLMEQQIDEVRTAGAAGVVVGTLLRDRRIDRIAAARLLRRARPMEAVFHRAIDVTPDPLDTLEALLTLSFDRVLTSGGAATALDGAETIRRMVQLAGNSLAVMAGGSVRGRNVRQLVEMTGVREVHARDVAGIREALTIAN